MSFNKARRKRDPFGPRFGELMGKHCHQALTAASRGKREEFDALVKDLYQMLDSIETETEWPEDIVKKVQATESMNPKTEKKSETHTKPEQADDTGAAEVPVPTPTVAPKSKPAAPRKRSKAPAKKRTPNATKTSDGYGDQN